MLTSLFLITVFVVLVVAEFVGGSISSKIEDCEQSNNFGSKMSKDKLTIT